MGTEYYRKLRVTLLHVSRTKVWLFTEGQSRVTKHIFEDQAIDHFHIDHNAPCFLILVGRVKCLCEIGEYTETMYES